jgi:hypothetical protein
LDALDPDTSPYQLNLLVVNPSKGKYYGPTCVICGQKSCSNCPLPILSQDTTLEQFLTNVVHSNKFNENNNLFINAEQLKD